MATQTLSAFSAVLKTVYRGTIQELLNQKTYLLDQIEKTGANDLGTFTGSQLVFAVHVGRNRGRGALTDGGQLPAAGRQTYLDATVPIRYFSQAIELTDQVIRQSATDEGAFVRAMESEMSGAMRDLRKDISRMAYGSGDGVLANCTTSQTSTTIAVDSAQYIAVGDTVDVLTKSNGAVKGSGLTVTTVAYTGTANSSTQTNANITLSSSVTVTSADAVYVSGDRNNESDGLANIISTGRTLFSIDSTTNPVWDSNVIDAANTVANEDLFMQLAQRIWQRSGDLPDLFLTSIGAQRRLANTYASQKRWNDSNATQINGGYSAIMVAAGGQATPVVADVDAPAGKAWAIRKDSFAWAELAKPDWLEAPDSNGSVFHLKDGSTAGSKLTVWQAWAIWYATLVNVAPLKNGLIKNINDDVPLPRL